MNQSTENLNNTPGGSADSLIDYADLTNKIGLVVYRDFPSTSAQTSTNYGYIFTPPFPFEVLSIVEKHDVAGTVSPVLDVLKVPNGTTPASGVSILSSTFDLTSTADTAVLKKGLDLNINRSFNPLDSIALKISGTLTTLEGVQVTIYIKVSSYGAFRNF